jgi:hypothetical protein
MSPAELELLLRKLLGEGLQLHPTVYLVIGLISVLSGGIGAFVGAYLRRRGENLATKTDFESLLAQLRQQTREVEEIKSEISQAGWIHQRRWDLKRELYAQLLVVLEEIKEKGRWFSESVSSHIWGATQELTESLQRFATHMQDRGTLDRFLSAKALAGMFLAPPAVAALDELSHDYSLAADMIAHSDNAADTVARNHVHFDALIQSTQHAYEVILAEAQQDLLGASDKA